MALPGGSTAGIIVGVGVGGAAAAALEPDVEVLKQAAWETNPQKLPDLGLIAELYAGGKISKASAQNMANRLGFSNGTLDSITWLSQNRSNFPTLLRMWRLAAVNHDFDAAALSELIDESLAHDRLDWKYQPYLRALKDAELVGLGDIAMGVVRSALPPPSYVPVPPPTSGLSVPRFPQVDIDPEQLAAALGFSKDMLHLMIARSGLSLAPGLAAQAHFREIINANDFLLAVAEGDLRTEWADTLLSVSRQIPSSEQYVEAHLRGWIDQAAMYAGTARHGMSQADTDIEFQIHRRPLTTHQVKQALARGANFNPEVGEITNPFEASVHQANLGPEWYEMAIALQGAYPPLFQVNRLVTAGIIDADTGADWMRKSGEADEVVTALHAYWSQTPVTKADPHVTKAQTQLWTTIHTLHKKGEITDAQATAALPTAGVDAAAIPEILKIWDVESALITNTPPPIP